MLTSRQRSYLMSLANTLEPIVSVGKMGATEQVSKALSKALADHEVVKVRFQDFKDEKSDLAYALAMTCKAELVRLVGNVAVFYKESPNPEKQNVVLPE